MRERKHTCLAVLCAFALLMNASGLCAQEKEPAKTPNVRVQRVERQVRVEVTDASDPSQVHVKVDEPLGDNFFVFVSGEMSFEGKVVKGSPYSADAVTESVQTLADGNRIVQKTTASIARDSEGRTRREHEMRAIGPFAATGSAPKTVFINDPVAGVSYVLDANARIARKMPRFERRTFGPHDVSITADGARQESVGTGGAVWMRQMPPPHAGPPPFRQEANVFIGARGTAGKEVAFMKPETESLGKRMVEGIEAEGTRSTITIPAGAIGNESPINIVSERWYSPELQTVVMSRNSDPRAGETVFRLTNLNRSDPARSLFEVPADFTVKEDDPREMKIQLEKKIRPASRDKQQQQ